MKKFHHVSILVSASILSLCVAFFGGRALSQTLTTGDMPAAGTTDTTQATQTIQTTKDTSPPSAPTSLRASFASGRVELSWNRSEDNVGVVGYRIFRNGSSYKGSSGNSFVDTSIEPGKHYEYRVTARDAEGNESGPSNSATVVIPEPPTPNATTDVATTGTITADTTAPTPPTSLTATVKPDGIQLGWGSAQDNVGVVGYRVFRNGSFLKATSDKGFFDPNVTPGLNYNYTVRAKDAAGNESGQSNTASVLVPAETIATTATTATGETTATAGTTTDTVPPSVPVGLVVREVREGLSLSWGKSEDNRGVSGYTIFRNGSFYRVSSGNEFLDTNIRRDTTYNYFVRAKDAAGNESGPSNAASRRTSSNTVETSGATADTESDEAETETTPSGSGTSALPLTPERIEVLVEKRKTDPPKKFFEEHREDSDGDGLSNAEEIARGTDPTKNDSDGDGFVDGDEVKSGFNPLLFSPGDGRDRVRFESPKEVAERESGTEPASPEEKKIQPETYAVESIKRVKKDDGKEVTRLSGKALPNSYITVFIYSDPIVVTLKTDDEGNWVYDLEKDLEDGEHEAYVAVTDNIGSITAQSVPLPFVKTAEAVTVRAQASSSAATESPVDRLTAATIVFGILLTLLVIGIGFLVIRRLSHVPHEPTS